MQAICISFRERLFANVDQHDHVIVFREVLNVITTFEIRKRRK